MNIDVIVDKLLDEIGQSSTDTVTKRSSLPTSDVLRAIIEGSTIRKASELLGVKEGYLESLLTRHIKPLFEKDSKTPWKSYLLYRVGLKICSKCTLTKGIEEFNTSTYNSQSLRAICKLCDNAKTKSYREAHREKCLEHSRLHYEANKHIYMLRSSARRLLLAQATPNWANLVEITKIYQNRPEGYHVDHIIPLQGDLVCGLHVENNLQYLTKEENLSKSNKFKVE